MKVLVYGGSTVGRTRLVIGRGPTVEEVKRFGSKIPVPFLCHLNCMEAVHPECNCWCGGILHGIRNSSN